MIYKGFDIYGAVSMVRCDYYEVDDDGETAELRMEGDDYTVDENSLEYLIDAPENEAGEVRIAGSALTMENAKLLIDLMEAQGVTHEADLKGAGNVA